MSEGYNVDNEFFVEDVVNYSVVSNSNSVCVSTLKMGTGLIKNAKLKFIPDTSLYYVPLKLSFYGKNFKQEMSWIYDRNCNVFCEIKDKLDSNCLKIKSLSQKVD